MKFSCEKSVIQAAVATSSRAVAPKSEIPALEGLLIDAEEDVSITGYDLRTGIKTIMPADVEEPGKMILGARIFGDIIRKLPDDIVKISSEDGIMAKICCGTSTFNILGTQAVNYPEMPTVEQQNSLNIPEKTLKAMISQTNFAVSTNEARPIHTGELFDAENGMLTVVAVDGYRLALRREPLENTQGQAYSFVVPGTALAEVEKIASDSDENVDITLGSKHIMFKIGNTVVVSRRLEGEFLNYKNSIPKNGKYSIKADKHEIIEAVERVSLIISDKQKSPVRCVFGENTLNLSTITPLGRATDACEISGDGEGLEIGFNNKYLLDALKAAPSNEIYMQLSTGVSPCIIVPADESQSFLYMILPVRLKANEG